MGIFDSIKKALSGDDDAGESIKGPSMLLREAGIDPSNMNFSFGADGNVAVDGYVADEATRAQVEEIIGGIEQVSSVTNNLVVGAPPAPAETSPPEPPSPDPAMQAETGRGLGAALESETASDPLPPATPAPAEAPAESEAADAAKTYTVQSGDTLWKIAEAHLGSGARYTEIFEANRDILDNPDLIRPGQVLKIP